MARPLKKFSRSPVVLTDMETCYFAALIEGVRIIEAKEAELIRYGRRCKNAIRQRLYSEPLQKYVQEKGKRIAIACGIRDCLTPVADCMSDAAAQIAHLEFREKELTAKLDRLAGHKTSNDHDIEAAVQRTKNALAQIGEEKARLTKQEQ